MGRGGGEGGGGDLMTYIFKALEVVSGEVFGEWELTNLNHWELAMAACCIGLMYDPVKGVVGISMEKTNLYMMAFGSTVLVCGVMIISKAAEDGIPQIGNCIFLVCLAVLNCVSGAFILKAYKEEYKDNILMKDAEKNQILSAGILAVINAALLIVDMILSVIK